MVGGIDVKLYSSGWEICNLYPKVQMSKVGSETYISVNEISGWLLKLGMNFTRRQALFHNGELL